MPMPLSGLALTLSAKVKDVQAEIVDVQEQLSKGTRTLNPAEDGIVTRLSAQASGYGTTSKNIDAAQAVIDVAQTALGSIATVMTQMKALATQAQSAGLQSNDLTSINTTFTQLASQVSSLATNATVNGNNLLGGSGISVTTGIDGSASSFTSVSGGAASTTIYSAISALTVDSTATARATRRYYYDWWPHIHSNYSCYSNSSWLCMGRLSRFRYNWRQYDIWDMVWNINRLHICLK